MDDRYGKLTSLRLSDSRLAKLERLKGEWGVSRNRAIALLIDAAPEDIELVNASLQAKNNRCDVSDLSGQHVTAVSQ